MSKYRFKTEEEFKKEGLWDKNCPQRWTISGNMNKYLGQDIPEEFNRDCDDGKSFSYSGWSFSSLDYVLKEFSFILPEKWCIKLTRENIETLGKWRSAGPLKNERYITEGWYLHTPKHEAKGYNEPRKDPEYTEITFEQFKQYVLTPSDDAKIVPEKENYEGRTIRALVKSPQGTQVQIGETICIIQLRDSNSYKLGMNSLGTSGLYIDYPLNLNQWELVSEERKEEIKKEIFYKGDYIVTLDVEDGYNCARRNYCFKQRVDFKGIYPAVDLKGSTGNGHGAMSFDKKELLKDWRYATKEEADEYERIGKPYDVTTLKSKEESIPEYVECIKPKVGFTVGNIYNWPYPLDDDKDTRCLTQFNECFKPSTKEAYEAQNAPIKTAEYIPQVGDYVVMEKAGGWGYHPDNNGCIAIVEKVSTKGVGYGSNSVRVPSIGGQIINAKSLGHVIFTDVPIVGHEKQTVFRKALPHEILNDLPKTTVIEEWSEGTYAVGIKGNFSIFTGSTYKIPIGEIYTINKERRSELIIKESQLWVYKKNLKWFATYEEALAFSNQLKASPVPKESNYPVMPEDAYPSIKKETFIDNVQSVDVMLRTKKKTIKF